MMLAALHPPAAVAGLGRLAGDSVGGGQALLADVGAAAAAAVGSRLLFRRRGRRRGRGSPVFRR